MDIKEVLKMQKFVLILANNVLIATRQEYKFLKKSGVNMDSIDKVLFITPKQAEELECTTLLLNKIR